MADLMFCFRFCWFDLVVMFGVELMFALLSCVTLTLTLAGESWRFFTVAEVLTVFFFLIETVFAETLSKLTFFPLTVVDCC